MRHVPFDPSTITVPMAPELPYSTGRALNTCMHTPMKTTRITLFLMISIMVQVRLDGMVIVIQAASLLESRQL